MASLKIFACKLDYDLKLSNIFLSKLLKNDLRDFANKFRPFLQIRFLVLKRYQDKDVASSFTLARLFLISGWTC